MKVVIIGCGNVATVLGRKISEAGNEIIQVYGRNSEKVRDLAFHFKSEYVTNLNDISTLGDIYIISVSDGAIKLVAEQLRLNDKMVVHTAAAVSQEVLACCSGNYGVLYPLQTLRKEIASLPEIPILVDGSNEKVREALTIFASLWTDTVEVADDEERLKLHVAAVLSGNFINHLVALSEKFCEINQLKFSILKPMIKETIVRIEDNSASLVQTGPASRKDFTTIEKHRKVLENDRDLLEVYNILTNSIVRFYNGNNG